MNHPSKFSGNYSALGYLQDMKLKTYVIIVIRQSKTFKNSNDKKMLSTYININYNLFSIKMLPCYDFKLNKKIFSKTLIVFEMMSTYILYSVQKKKTITSK